MTALNEKRNTSVIISPSGWNLSEDDTATLLPDTQQITLQPLIAQQTRYIEPVLV